MKTIDTFFVGFMFFMKILSVILLATCIVWALTNPAKLGDWIHVFMNAVQGVK